MKRKVLMTASTYRHINSFHLPYLRELQRLGWETHVGCAGIPGDAPYIDQGIELPFEKRMRSASNFRAARLLRGKIKAEGYDLIITHTSLAAFFTRLAVKGMKHRPRLVNVVHGYLFDDETPVRKRSILLTAERFAAPETDLLLTMNEWDFRAAKRYGLGKRIEKIPGMGVDFSRLDSASAADGLRLRQRFGISRDTFVLLCAAEFSERKSQAVLIRAMQYLPKHTLLVLCGTGATEKECRLRKDELRLGDRVFFAGQIADMGAWYRMADAAVTASRSEGLPFNVMEALHTGLPVVASAVKGHTDLIKDGETGLLYPYGNAEACAARVRRLMDDTELRVRLGTRGRVSAEAYGMDKVLPVVMERYITQ